MIRHRSIFFLIASTALLPACMGVDRERPVSTVGRAEAPVLGWRLPKTVLDVSVSYVPKSCALDAQKVPRIDPAIDVAVVARAVPDPDLGPEAVNGMVMLTPGDEKSFWVDRNISYKVHPDKGGLLAGLSSHPVNQGGTIVGNFLTGFVKLAGAAFGVPAAGSQTFPTPQCGRVDKVLKEIKRLRDAMPNVSGKTAADYALRVTNLLQSITVTQKVTIDPAAENFRDDGSIKDVLPDKGEAVKAGWFSEEVAQDEKHKVTVKLDFAKANLLASGITPGKKDSFQTQQLHRGALFRQAAYIPVIAENGGKVLGTPKIIAFGQFGAPRSLPLTTSAFRDTNWELEFTEYGEVTKAVFADKAMGVGLSSAFSGAAAAASSIQQLGVANAGQLDSDTLRLQAENAALQAEIDNKNLKAQREALNASAPQP